MKQQPSREFYLPNNKPDNKPEVAHYVRFAEDEEKLGRMLEVAGAVGIVAEPITDPKVAGQVYGEYAHEENARRERSGQTNYPHGAPESSPGGFYETARDKVKAGQTMLYFTTTGPQALQPFADEYMRRFSHNTY